MIGWMNGPEQVILLLIRHTRVLSASKSLQSTESYRHFFHRELQDLLYSFVTSNSSDSVLSAILADSNVTSEDVTRLRQQLTPLFPANYR